MPIACLRMLATIAVLLLAASSPARAADPVGDPVVEPGLFSPSRLATAGGMLTHPAQFAPASVCAGCHPGIVSDWTGSMHSRAHQDPLYRALAELAGQETAGLTDRFCAGCHSPVGVASGEVPPRGNPLMSRSGAESLSCDFCHTIDRALGTGNLPAVLDPGTLRRGPRRDAVSPFHTTSFLELSTQAEFCGLCHDVSHPLNGLPIENTYSEWKAGPYNALDPAERVFCQDCHMRQRPGLPATGMTPRPDTRGKPATMGPWRPHLYSHVFVGGNAAMTARLGSPEHASMAGERLRSAATLEIAEAGIANGRLSLSVRVTNSGAGHWLPTGLTELRQMWLEATVSGPSGEIYWQSPPPGEHGLMEPPEALFTTVLGDADGKPTWKVWQAVSILSDRRIPPRESREARWDIPLQRERATLPLTVSARLLYRSWPPELALALLGPGNEAPVVEMAVARRQFDPPPRP